MTQVRSLRICEGKAMKQTRLSLFSALSLMMIFAATLFSQATTGNLSGVVTDPSGAIVAGAEVKLINMGTGISQIRSSNSAGLFEFPFLPLGRYEVAVSNPGFSTFRQTGIEITASSPVTLNVNLSVGEVSEVVEVSETTPVLQVREASTGAVINEQKIDELPVYGRSPFQLLNMIPGSSVSDVSGDGQQTRINGSRMGMTKYLMDGVSISRENQRGNGVIFTPQLESLAEVTVIANNFSAEYGRVQGAVVAMNLKSGTNQYHGDVYEFFRNSALNARNFFAPGKKPLFNLHQFGATLGGPIVKNKLFFFAAYEGARALTPRTGILNTVPTENMRRGDFSEISTPIFDPQTTSTESPYGREAFAGNIIPTSRLNASGLAALQLYPLPNRPGIGSNYLTNPNSRNRGNQLQTKVDYQIGTNDRVYVRLTVDPRNTASDPVYETIGNTNTAFNSTKNYGTQINHSHVFNASFINELRIGYQDTNNVFGSSDEQLQYLGDKIGIPSNDPASTGFPNIRLAGCAEDCALGVAAPFGNDKQKTYSVDDVVSSIRGNHSIKFGGGVRRVTTFEQRANCPAGCYTFSGKFTNNPANAAQTGYALADVVLGMPVTVDQSFSTPVDFRSTEYSLFVQDDIKVTRKLTLNLGVRWDYFGSLQEAEGRISAYDPELDQLVQKTELSEPSKRLFSPRLGLAYLLTEKTVLRTAYGISTFPQLQGIGPEVRGIAPFSRSQLVENRGTFYETLTQPAIPFGQALPNIPQAQFPLTPTPSLRAPLFPDYIPTPYWQMWNVAIQHELQDNFSVEVAYVGTKGVHLDSVVNLDANLPAASMYGPDANFGGLTFQQRKPYPHVGYIAAFGNWGDSEYNALQATAHWRYKWGLSFDVAYSKQKAMTNHPGRCCNTEFRTGVGGTTFQKDASNRRLQWAPDGSTPYDVLLINYNYELPFGNGKRYMNTKGVLDAVLGGWQVSGVYTARSGNQFGVSSSSAEQRYPDRICDGNLPSGERTLERWFDTSCFVNPTPIYSLGNSGYAIILGPGTSNMDFTLHKNFTYFERVRMQLRADFFNLTNTPQFFIGRAVTLGTPNFGRVTNSGSSERGLTSQANRSIQLGLKFSF